MTRNNCRSDFESTRKLREPSATPAGEARRRFGTGTPDASEVLVTVVHPPSRPSADLDEREAVEHHGVRVGFYAATAAFIAALGFSVVQVMQVLG
ncbi:MAG: hypothetical protein ABI678_15480, partial [Kofleriaceae bacterium]